MRCTLDRPLVKVHAFNYITTHHSVSGPAEGGGPGGGRRRNLSVGRKERLDCIPIQAEATMQALVMSLINLS